MNRMLLFVFLLSARAIAADIDLSYVDKSGANFAAYKAWVIANIARPDYGYRAVDADYMAKLDGGAQYCTAAIAFTDAYAAKVNAAIAAGGQPNWSADSNGVDGISSDSYLHVEDNIGDFAFTLKWCASSLTPAQVATYTAIGNQAIFNVWNYAHAAWGGRSFPWSGWATNDPANNYFYSFLGATELWRWATGDTQWDAYLTPAWALVNNYMATIPTGGSEEGTGYGVSHRKLFELIRFHRDIDGVNFADAHLTNTADYWLYAATPDFLHFGCIGDQSRVSDCEWYDYHCDAVSQSVKMSLDPAAAARGTWLIHHACQSVANGFNRRNSLLYPEGNGTAPTSLCYFGQSTGDLFCRTGWDAGALWCHFRAGKYDQVHAHQDQGNVECYENGKYLLVDQSAWSHSGIQQAVTNNSTIAFYRNGAASAQVFNSTSSMTVTGSDPAQGIHAVANLAPAAGAAVSAWTRTVDFVGRTLTVADAFTANAGYSAVWQLQVPVQPTISGNVVTAGALKATILAPANPTITAVDMRTVSSDYAQGWRIEVRGGASGYTVALTDSTTPTCTNPPPSSTPLCSDGTTHETGGTWTQAPYPACTWTYVNGTCPAPPTTYRVTLTQAIPHGTVSHIFAPVVIGDPIQTSLALSPVLHWHAQHGSDAFEFPNAGQLKQTWTVNTSKPAPTPPSTGPKK